MREILYLYSIPNQDNFLLSAKDSSRSYPIRIYNQKLANRIRPQVNIVSEKVAILLIRPNHSR